MPPKREPSSGKNINSNYSNETPTASFTNNPSSITLVLQSTTTTSSTSVSNSGNTTTTTASAANVLPVLITDAAAEQRTIAYQANAKLCRLVRKCPWMYDRNHHNYAKKHILDKSWLKIAKKCNDSVASCKERWRNIRAAFARSINIYKTHSGPNRVKPYYLHKELSFLVKPMMEGRDRKDEYDDNQEGVKDEEAGEENDAAEEDEEEEEEEEEEEQREGGDGLYDETAEIKSAFEALNPDIRIQAETKYQKVLKNNNINNNNNNNNNNNEFGTSGILESRNEFTNNSDGENEFHFPDDALSQAEVERRVTNISMINQNGLKRPMHLETETLENKRSKLSHNSTTASENDIRFLEALLPDMALMNTRQKIVFKRKIYQTLEEVFENSNDFPNIEQTRIEQNVASVINPGNSFSINGNHNFNSASSHPSNTQIKQTVLTVNSATARSLINNIANLNELELQKVNGFLKNSVRNHTTANHLSNGTNTPSSAAAKLMSSTPKITITKVSCPPPAALRNLALNKPPSPSPNIVSTTIHNPTGLIVSSNVHSTTSSNQINATTIQNSNSTNNKNSPWSQLLPITIKDEIEDVDIV